MKDRWTFMLTQPLGLEKDALIMSKSCFLYKNNIYIEWFTLKVYSMNPSLYTVYRAGRAWTRLIYLSIVENQLKGTKKQIV